MPTSDGGGHFLQIDSRGIDKSGRQCARVVELFRHAIDSRGSFLSHGKNMKMIRNDRSCHLKRTRNVVLLFYC